MAERPWQRALLSLRYIGSAGARRALLYALVRDAWNRRLPPPKGPWRPVGPPLAMEALPGGARFRFPEAELEALFFPGGLRLTWSPGRLPPSYWNPELSPIEPLREEREGRFALEAQGVRLEVGPEGLRFLRAGRVFRREALPERRKEAWRHRVALAPGERLYGLGSVAAPLDRRGRAYRLWNRDVGGSYGPEEGPLYLTIPVLLSHGPEGGHLVFYENPHEALVDLTQPEEALWTFMGGALRYHLFPGDPKEALSAYTALVGRPPLPPRFALGFHYARWGLSTEEEVREVAEGFLARGLPLSALHLDIDYMEGHRVFTVDRDRFPHLEELIADLRAKGVRTVLILDPGVKAEKGFPPYEEGLREGVFCTLPGGALLKAPVWPGWCAFPDFTHPRARAWWGRWVQTLWRLGVGGFWLDMNEPAAFAAWGDPTFPLPTRHALEGEEGDHRLAHNLYGLLMARATYEALKGETARPFLFSRSGWAGLARYAWNWTGDVESSWPALRRTVGIVLGLGLSGVPYTGSDIGGFSGHPSSELFLRWFQVGAFMPFFRVHSAITTPRREPWRFGEPVLSVVRRFLELRQALLPYLYTLAWEASQTGLPPVRPLFFLDPSAEAEDAFLLGEALLVAPVLEEGVRGRSVPLPRGPWYEFWTDRLLEGPGEVQVEAPLDRIPLFVWGGAALPLLEGEGLTLHLYPDREGRAEGLLYWDEGEGEGPFRLDRFRLEGGRLLWAEEGAYPWPWEGLGVRLHGKELLGAWVEGRWYGAREGRLRLPPFREARLEVKG
ncbi:glycoside hydrolase family 31 protein [Thermus oshimai]|jgi:alpha-glucosidase